MLMRRALVSLAMAAVSVGFISGAGRVALAAGEAESADVPIRAITLYRSGVGSFERQGMISGEKTVELRFETEQINDILKSMVLLDLDGGKIGGVSYGSKEPLERRLKSFGVDISDSPTISQLFSKLRGARVSIVSTVGSHEGSILGVEARPMVEAVGDKGGVVVQTEVLNLLTSTGVVSIPIPKISTFSLADKGLQDELNRALAAVAEHREDRLKSVDIRFVGAEKPRRVVVAYVTEMPVWKTSYRLVLPESAKDGKDSGKPTLQGWAIVENTTDADWKDVRLSLASGRPVSFTMDLYEPIFAPRPMLPVPVMGGIMPRVYEAARRMRAEDKYAAQMGAGGSMAKAAEMVASQMNFTEATRERGSLAFDSDMAPGAAPTSPPPGAYSDYAATSQAAAGEVGEQFMYTLDAPVTIERQRSAMLPILAAGITGRRVSIYNANDLAKHPMRGVQLKNDSGLHLMPGPIAVYDGNSYAGDAQIPHTSRSQDRLLAYALDIDVSASRDVKESGAVVKLRVVDGLLEQKVKQERTTTYEFNNYDSARGRMVLVEHPKSPEWELIEPKKPSEGTDNLYRFEAPIEASKDTKLTVKEERVSFSSIAVTGIDMPTLLAYAKDGKASPAVVDAVKKAAELQSKINTLQSELSRLKEERDEIARDQSRIRDNMSRIDHNSELYGRYMKKLNEQETRLEQLVGQTDDTEKKLDAATRELNDYLRGLDVE
jgi:hypothetical protein